MRSTNNRNFALASLLIDRELKVPLGTGLKRDLVPITFTEKTCGLDQW